ncbi:MAG: Hsp70 family protein [Thermoguttaceae bacterium]
MKQGKTSSSTASRYVVGFDLGTTNSAVTYVDTTQSPWRIQTFAVPQLVAPGQVEARETLPSFHYQPAAGELSAGALRLPWQKTDPAYAVGFFARDHGATAPGRLIASAKSWLCHSGVDRTAALLPWQGADDVERLSPVEVSSRYLCHVRDAWNARFPHDPLEQQDFVLTLPASFDEVARELTVRAAAAAGLPRVVLIEEPQAAFYSWIDDHADNWEQKVSPGQKILVCDIGGGTSDFTLIRVRSDRQGKVQFHRVAVGDHLILGGDNFDLTLARWVEQKLGRLEPRQWLTLVRVCRAAKETLLGPDAPERMTIHLPGGGSRLLGGGVGVEVTRQEVCDLLVEGFFPRVSLEEKPLGRQSGFQEFGLPFAPDPAITRYLAAFLTAHRNVAIDESQPTTDHDPARPDIVLFNGGVFESPRLRERLLESFEHWFGVRPTLLDNGRLDLAVARGAAYYGMVRRGQGVRIAAGLARTYYVGVESSDSSPSPSSPLSSLPSPLAVCVLPAGIEPGQDVVLKEPSFKLLVSEPAEFPLLVSSTRLTDKPGDVVAVDREQLTPLPPMRTVLRTRKRDAAETVAVDLHARLTEIGTLELWLSEIGGRRSWRLQFDVRSTTQTDIAAHQSQAEGEGILDEAAWPACQTLIDACFGSEATDKPEGLVKRLSAAAGMSRGQWPTSFCRRLWEALMAVESGRRLSAAHEARWLNLLGFALRPGYGLAVDDWRVAQTWTALQGKFAHASANVRVEGWVLWRRIGGGLAAGQQQALADSLLGPIRSLHRQLTTGRGGSDFSFSIPETAEMWRLLGSLELLSADAKTQLGDMVLDMLPKRKMEPVRSAMIWAIGRLGARTPLYGPLNAVVPARTAARWVERLIAASWCDVERSLAVMQLARRTDDRYRDVPEKLRAEAAGWLDGMAVPSHFAELVRRGGSLDDEEQGLVFGESLPVGLRIT